MAPNSATVAAGVAATFHLLRLTVDLVTTASDKAKSNDDKIENSKADVDKEKDDAGATRGRPSIMRRLSVTGFDGRLSVRDFQTPWSSNNNNSTAAADNVGRSGRRSTVSSMISNSFRSATQQAALADDVEGQNEGLANPKGALEASIPMISLVLHLTIFAYLLAATILTATSSVETRPQFANAMYDAVPLGCATTAVFIGILMNLRDFHRKRFGSLNRGLYSISALILLV
ncbi:hypothetical protein ACHAWC_000535, partial [Mediolabrus comicus]